MKFYSTNNNGHRVSFREAVLESLPPDNGLYLPEVIDPLPASFIENLSDFSFQEIAFKVTRQLIGDSIPDSVLAQILNDALTFPVPLVKVTEGVSILELFHGPSLAFKDFGAAFMSRVMGYLNQGASQDLVVLVATSGDTGGAVASGFFEAPGVQVVILYPSGKVSALQEKQLTTWGGNIHALEVEGTFDDCQQLVKQAFLDDSSWQGISIYLCQFYQYCTIDSPDVLLFRRLQTVESYSREGGFLCALGQFWQSHGRANRSKVGASNQILFGCDQ
jgi:threonine synthase